MSETLADSFAADPFAGLRETMVERQIRTFDVSDLAVQERMKTVPREIFVDDAYVSLAYSDARVLVTGTSPRELTAPLILGRMLKEAHVRATDRALVVGGASGYAAALLAGLALSVVSLDEDAALSARAQASFTRLCLANATSVTGPLRQGAAAAAPFDLILVDGVVTGGLEALCDQLTEGGRMVAIVGDAPGARTGRATLFTRADSQTSGCGLFSASAATLTALTAPPVFVF
ncbi:protein-L-isoaspartate(D-aspartate) O-methyltransferase [Rhodoblastus sphagnicola]|nr:protein-L-isoaspartate O-methyltransferase [Rhodoblastus sphagnicola]MBB4198122.1 protein-L-isoaspartate(D-aspartate) O-methyltransferase [Rhodoblastus sphagnicola]